MEENPPRNELIPDITGFRSSISHSSKFSGVVQTSTLTNETISKHTLQQMIAAQQTGEKVGFIKYGKTSANVLGGEENSWNSDYDENSVLGIDKDGVEYLVMKVSFHKESHELVIESVKIESRTQGGVPDGKMWSAVGYHRYYSEGGSHYARGEWYENRYQITHKDGVTSLVPMKSK